MRRLENFPLAAVALGFALSTSACAVGASDLTEPADDDESVTSQDLRAGAKPTIHLGFSDRGCIGPFYQVTAEWGGNARTYELRYNTMTIATSRGPSAYQFRPGARRSTVSLVGCNGDACTTISRALIADDCSRPGHPDLR